jgi:hypothetical protein
MYGTEVVGLYLNALGKTEGTVATFFLESISFLINRNCKQMYEVGGRINSKFNSAKKGTTTNFKTNAFRGSE